MKKQTLSKKRSIQFDEDVILTKDTVYTFYGYNERTGEYVRLCDFDLYGIVNNEDT